MVIDTTIEQRHRVLVELGGVRLWLQSCLMRQVGEFRCCGDGRVRVGVRVRVLAGMRTGRSKDGTGPRRLSLEQAGASLHSTNARSHHHDCDESGRHSRRATDSVDMTRHEAAHSYWSL